MTTHDIAQCAAHSCYWAVVFMAAFSGSIGVLIGLCLAHDNQRRAGKEKP